MRVAKRILFIFAYTWTLVSLAAPFPRCPTRHEYTDFDILFAILAIPAVFRDFSVCHKRYSSIFNHFLSQNLYSFCDNFI